MKKIVRLSFLLLPWILVVAARIGASEKLLFVDYTQNQHVLSLRDFFARETNLSVVSPPELPPQEEIRTPAYFEKLIPFGNLLFVAYRKDALL
ncbi:MAG: hypothetical protein N2Z84_04290, partial [Atribacterota bacterium]|nr:hypothetical protein [Atribacterota bacterium]